MAITCFELHVCFRRRDKKETGNAPLRCSETNETHLFCYWTRPQGIKTTRRRGCRAMRNIKYCVYETPARRHRHRNYPNPKSIIMCVGPHACFPRRHNKERGRPPPQDYKTKEIQWLLLLDKTTKQQDSKATRLQSHEEHQAFCLRIPHAPSGVGGGGDAPSPATNPCSCHTPCGVRGEATHRVVKATRPQGHKAIRP